MSIRRVKYRFGGPSLVDGVVPGEPLWEDSDLDTVPGTLFSPAHVATFASPDEGKYLLAKVCRQIPERSTIVIDYRGESVWRSARQRLYGSAAAEHPSGQTAAIGCFADCFASEKEVRTDPWFLDRPTDIFVSALLRRLTANRDPHGREISLAEVIEELCPTIAPTDIPEQPDPIS